MGNLRALRRWSATAAAVAALGVPVGAIALAIPAQAAASGLDIKVTNSNIQGKPGDKVSVGFQVTNRGREEAKGDEVIVAITVPSQAQLDPADYSDNCGQINGGRAVRCRLGKDIPAGKSAGGSFKFVLKTGGNGQGAVAVQPGNANDRFTVRVSGASPSKTPSGKASSSAAAEPTVEAAPPEAGNGAIPQAEDPPKRKTSDSGGLSFGFWVGIFAIVAALGLVGSLFYFRRKDKREPDTGMHPVVPAPGGLHRPPTPTTYGSPQGNYGSPQGGYGPPQGGYEPPGYGGAPTTVINPGYPPPPQQGGNDQTVIFRRPGDI
ncbi:hypothetical protein KZZ52_09095 [Dactylosporangium sp. AC04546]|uniref:hypothetical protein n=1 Tax=Dactylosporangium sp. AC04546 TaxID=2862460 RepID=UPI002E7B6252|nr:hypothetical protein [Dactylosporangium sp. AC04546]WVK85523.1 hypothetical protein KZZ52_09095 [Dactylosporangium sp. AC04546]